MATELHTSHHEDRREQGLSISAERNSRGFTVSAKVWDTDDARAMVRLRAVMAQLNADYPAKHAE